MQLCSAPDVIGVIPPSFAAVQGTASAFVSASPTAEGVVYGVPGAWLVDWYLLIQHSGQHSGLTHRNTGEKTYNRTIVQATAWTRTLPCLLL